MFLIRKLRRRVLPLALFATVILVTGNYGQSTSPIPAPLGEGQQVGKVVSVRKVLRNQYFVSRYPQIHYYLLYLTIRAPNQTYCSEYETPVLDEIGDVLSAKDKDVEFVFKGRSLTIRTPRGRTIKTHLVDEKQC